MLSIQAHDESINPAEEKDGESRNENMFVRKATVASVIIDTAYFPAKELFNANFVVSENKIRLSVFCFLLNRIQPFYFKNCVRVLSVYIMAVKG